VVLEDIDTVTAAKDRDKSDGVTMQGLLNVLDGFQSPHGVITIMTTNHRETLDPAIIRPGRVDLEESLSAMDDSQLRKLCMYAMEHVPEDLPHITPEDGITSAMVMGEVRKHVPNFEEAADDIVKLVTEKVLTELEKVS